MSKDDSKEDSQARIENLKRQVKEHGKGDIISFGVDECPSELQEQFWEHVLSFEQGQHITLFETLVNGGLSLPSPETLDEAQLSKKLWQVINAMSLLGVFLYSTDHLSDRGLYEHLWHDSLREEGFFQPTNQDLACHLDILGSGSEEDIFLFLKYYANDEERSFWADDFPLDDFPAPEKKPYDRDRLLPKRENWGNNGTDQEYIN